MYIDVKVVSTSASVLTKETFLVCLINSFLDLVSFMPKFSSDVDIRCFCSHTESNHKGTFDQLHWLVSQDFSIFACAWLRLITIDNKVLRPIEI